MRDVKKVVAVVLGGAAWWLASCRDIPAPEDGVLALSPVFLPSPGLVVNDTMRDSTGLAAPLRVIAYGVDGQPVVPPSGTKFIVLDTGAHLDGSLLIGDDAGTTVRVVGSVGSLQSQLASVKVTASPDAIVAADLILHRKAYTIFGGDTAVNSPDLSVLVQHVGATTTGVEAVIVHYTIDKKPTSNGNGETVALANGSKLSNRDTTDVSGKAARTARLRIGALPPPFGVDTVLVSATSSYRGLTLGTVQFTIIYTNAPQP